MQNNEKLAEIAIKYVSRFGVAALAYFLGNTHIVVVAHAQGPDSKVKYVQGQSQGDLPLVNIPAEQGMTGYVTWDLDNANQSPIRLGPCKVVLTEGGPFQGYFLKPDGSVAQLATSGTYPASESYDIEWIGAQSDPGVKKIKAWFGGPGNGANFEGWVDERIDSYDKAEKLMDRATADQLNPALQGGQVFNTNIKYAIVGPNGVLLESGSVNSGKRSVEWKSDQPFPIDQSCSTAQIPPVGVPTSVAPAPVSITDFINPDNLPTINHPARSNLPLNVVFEGSYVSNLESGPKRSLTVHLLHNEIFTIAGQGMSIAGLDSTVDSASNPLLTQVIAIHNKGSEIDLPIGLKEGIGYSAVIEKYIGSEEPLIQNEALRQAAETQANRLEDPSKNNCIQGQGCSVVVDRGFNVILEANGRVFYESAFPSEVSRR